MMPACLVCFYLCVCLPNVYIMFVSIVRVALRTSHPLHPSSEQIPEVGVSAYLLSTFPVMAAGLLQLLPTPRGNEGYQASSHGSLCLGSCPGPSPSPPHSWALASRWSSHLQIQTHFHMGSGSRLPPPRTRGSRGFQLLPLYSACLSLSSPANIHPLLGSASKPFFPMGSTHSLRLGTASFFF